MFCLAITRVVAFRAIEIFMKFFLLLFLLVLLVLVIFGFSRHHLFGDGLHS